MDEVDYLQKKFLAVIEAHGVANNDRTRYQMSRNTAAQRYAQDEMTRLGFVAIDIQLRQIPEAMSRCGVG